MMSYPRWSNIELDEGMPVEMEELLREGSM